MPLNNLPQPLAVLRCRAPDDPLAAETTFYVLGTAHVSAASCADVVSLIRAVRPEVVLVELCVERKALLTMEKVKVGGGCGGCASGWWLVMRRVGGWWEGGWWARGRRWRAGRVWVVGWCWATGRWVAGRRGGRLQLHRRSQQEQEQGPQRRWYGARCQWEAAAPHSCTGLPAAPHTARAPHGPSEALPRPRPRQEPTLVEVWSEIRSGRATPFQGIYGWMLAKVWRGGREAGAPPSHSRGNAWRELGAASGVALVALPMGLGWMRGRGHKHWHAVHEPWAVLRCAVQVGKNQDVMPGEEFRVALREAHAMGVQVRRAGERAGCTGTALGDAGGRFAWPAERSAAPQVPCASCCSLMPMRRLHAHVCPQRAPPPRQPAIPCPPTPRPLLRALRRWCWGTGRSR